jgi:hypothetical protein
MSAPLPCKDAVEALLSSADDPFPSLDTKHSEFAELVNRVIEDLVSHVKANAEFDLQPLIDAFLCNEQDQIRERKQFQAAVAALQSAVPKGSKRQLVLRARRLFELLDGFAGIYRQARWHLMYARAFYAPRRGVGEIRGSNGDC